MLRFARLLGACLCFAGLFIAQVGVVSAASPTQTSGTPEATAPIKVPAVEATVAPDEMKVDWTPAATEASETPAAIEATETPAESEASETPSAEIETPIAIPDHTPMAAAANSQAEATPIPTDRPPLPTVVQDASFENNVKGMVVNWAYRNESDFPVSLSGGGWNVDAKTDGNARFAFQALGEGVAVLNPIIAKGSGLEPMTVDLAFLVSGPADRAINLGVYGGSQYPTGLPMAIQMQSSAARVDPGQEVQFVVDVKNEMPHTVHEVMVTDLMPDGLMPTYIESSAGLPWIGGQFAAASIGSLDEGQSAVVTITAQLAPDASADRAVTNRANVIYQESVALQASATINGQIPNQLPETGSNALALPLSGLALLVAVVGLRRMRLNRA